MKNQKSKIIAFLLVFALLIATVIVTSVANAKETDVLITADRENISAGESATVSVKVTTNYPVATMSIPVFYDKTLVDVSEATATLTEYSVANTTLDSQSVDTAKIYANTDIDSNKFGFVLATYIGGANKEVAESIDEIALTFKITAKETVSGNAVVKVVEESAKTSENVSGMLYFGAVPKGRTITDIPENVENVTLEKASKNINIVSNKAELLITANGKEIGAVINKKLCLSDYNGAIYGIDALNDETVKEYFTASMGSVEIIENENGVLSTGATINLLDDDGNVVETYIFVYFGDVNGDEVVDITDAVAVELHDAWIETIEEDTATYYAAEVNYDATLDITDGVAIELHDAWIEMLPEQAEIAAGMMHIS